MHNKAFKKELGLIKKTKKKTSTFLEIIPSTFIQTKHSCLIMYFLHLLYLYQNRLSCISQWYLIV